MVSLFGPKRQVSVDSVVYNLAGDEINRPDYLKSLVIGNVLADSGDSMGETINTGYLNGPGIKLRSFYRWCLRPGNWTAVGIPTARLVSTADAEPTVVQPYITVSSGRDVLVQKVEIGSADFGMWVDQWMLLNHPDKTDQEYVASEESGLVTIVFPNGDEYTFYASTYNPDEDYIYAYYSEVLEAEEGTLETGPTVSLGSSPFPPITGWTLEDTTITPVIFNLEKTTTVETTISYSDGRPDEVTTETLPVVETSLTYDTKVAEYEKSTYLGGDQAGLKTRFEFMYHMTNAKVVTAYEVTTDETTEPDEDDPTVEVTTTVKTTVATESVAPDNSYRIDQREDVATGLTPVQVWIYQIGTGLPVLDALMFNQQSMGNFFPFIPARLNGTMMDEETYPNIYPECKKAFKKLTGSKLSKFVDKLADNESLEDIDSAFIVPGVSLNVKENACRRYIFEFFKMLEASQGTGGQFDNWFFQQQENTALNEAWQAWMAAQGDESNPLFGTPEPERPQYSTGMGNMIRIASPTSIYFSYDVRISWRDAKSGNGVGKAKPDAKVGELWFDQRSTAIFPGWVPVESGGTGGGFELDQIRLYWQRTANSYQYVDVWGLFHQNYVYGKHSVDTQAKAALQDQEESAFIIPLHYDTYRQMPLIDATQMSTACVFGVLNCYEIKKQKWYQTWWFTLILVVVIAILSVVFTGGAGIGLLGAHMSVGSALGFSGMTAAIVGSVINSLAALVLVTIVEQVATKIFGPVIGGIIAAVFGMLIVNVSSNLFSTGSLAINWGSLLSAENLLSLTNSVGNAYAKMVQADTAGIQQDMKDYTEQSKAQLGKLQQAAIEQFGVGQTLIDPMMFVDSSDQFVGESSTTFLSRTLMTGSQIVEMSQELLYDFPKYSLQLPDAFM